MKEGGAKPNPETAAEELLELTKAYLRQETLDPLRSLGRRVGYGVLGSLCVGLGAIFIGSAVLRLVPRHVSATSRGILSSIVYFVAGVALVAVIGASWKVGMRRR